MSQRHVAVSMDFSPSSKYALNWAMENVVKDKDHVVLILVNKKDGSSQGLWEEQGSPLIPLSEFSDSEQMKQYDISPDAEVLHLLEVASKEKKLTVLTKIYWGDAREKIMDAVVEHPIQMLIMGSRGLGTLKRALLGSVSNFIVNNAPCPVTVVKMPEHVADHKAEAAAKAKNHHNAHSSKVRDELK